MWQDPHSYRPLILAVVLVESQVNAPPHLYRFGVDCRNPDVVAPLGELFRMPLPFVAHELGADLFCLWRLGLSEPGTCWDTWVAEKALLLGRFHAQYLVGRAGGEADEARAREGAEEEEEFRFHLVSTCARRGVPYQYPANKVQLQKSIQGHPDGAPFSKEQIEANVCDAEAAALLYPAQVHAATSLGCMQHLVSVEMPWTVTNAHMVWDGVRVDQDKCREVLAASARHLERVSRALTGMGLANPDSHPQVEQFFRDHGLLAAFRVRGGYSFDEDRLEAAEALHPAVALIQRLRKFRRLGAEKSFTGELVGSDGRLHPDHRQLGADSGRNSMRHPNVGGVGRALRPAVIPEEGYGIGEVDLSQIEVGIAAAVYGDPDLIRMFNARDVYTRMAKAYYAADLPPGASDMPDKEFKKRFGPLRDRMKISTLATIYGITPYGLALRLGISRQQAEQEQQRFLAMFPALTRALKQASDYGTIRGCVSVCSGLRRWRARSGEATTWETNWMCNTPVQGSACVVFKAAGNRLYRRFKYYDARIILPMHDAFVFEAPLTHLETVAAITAEVLKGAVQEYFPELDPQVEPNIDHPDCWNKDGNANSLDRWIAEACGSD